MRLGFRGSSFGNGSAEKYLSRMTAQQLFRLRVIAVDGVDSLVSDGTSRFWVLSSALSAPIICDPADTERVRAKYDTWVFRSVVPGD